MKKSLICLIIFIMGLSLGMYLDSLDKKVITTRESYMGAQVIINEDTLYIVDYNYGSYLLSNGIYIHHKLVDHED